MSPYQRLGVAADADERTIKRAYARCLRDTRPEDDAQAFQELHAAYQAALAQLDRRRVAASSPAPPFRQAPSTVAGSPQSSREPTPEPAFSPHDFVASMFELANTGDPIALEAWLHHREELWSLPIKMRLGRFVLAQLHRQAPPMPTTCLDALLGFFDLDHVHAGHDAFAMQRLRFQMQMIWDLDPAHPLRLERRMDVHSALGRARLTLAMQQLQRPFHWSQALLAGLLPRQPSQIASVLQRLSGNHADPLPPSFNRQQMTFWRQATDRSQPGRARLFLGLARTGTLLLLVMLLALLQRWLPLLGDSPSEFALYAAAAVIGSALLWFGLIGWRILERWQTRAEFSTVRQPWLCLLLIPLMCVAGLALDATPFDGIGLILLIPAAWLALRRYAARRRGRGLTLGPGMFRVIFFLSVPACKLLADLFKSGQVAALASMMAAIAVVGWVADFWLNRRQLRIRND